MINKPRLLNLVLMFMILFSALGFMPKPVTAAPSELFFSEYIEGSGNNKALEIYNGTGATVDLDAGNYEIKVYFNGSTTAGTTIDLTGTVADGDVYVVADDSSDPAILAEKDQLTTASLFNGDDAVALIKDVVIIDVIGQIGVDPGDFWGTSPTTTQNHTLTRMETICAGDTDGGDAFDPATEWVSFPEDTFSELGSHYCVCGPVPTIDPKINEFVANHDGTDTDEFIEVFGEPDTDYSVLTLLEIEGDGTSAGYIDGVFPVGTTNSEGIWWTGFLGSDIENGTITLLLVKGFTGSADTDLDTDNDGIFNSTPWEEIIDSVAVTDGDAGDLTYGLPVLAPNYDGNSFTPGGASRIPDGYDTETDMDWVRNAYYLTGLPGIGEAYNTPGALNSANACGGDFTPIYEIQGSGDVTPLDGTDVVTEGIVVGDFQTSGYVSGTKNGFYIQDMTGDGDPSTSDGVFVYYYGSDVQVGDYVRVTGEATEYNEVTQLGYIDSMVVCDVGQPLPEPTEVSLPVADKDDLETLEGMRVIFPQDLVVAEYYNFDRYGEIVLTSQRYNQFTAGNEPDVEGFAAAGEEFIKNSITLDDARSNQNADPAIHPNGLEFTIFNYFRGGDLVTNLTGIMDYGFYLWRIQPTEGADYTPANPRTTAPDIIEGDVKVASFNVLNYFTTLDTGAPICGPSEDMDCRGANTEEEFTRQKTKIIEALSIIDADIVGLMEIENDQLSLDPDYSVADLVAGLNAKYDAEVYDYIATGAIGADVIKVALIYKPDKVTPVGDYAILDSSVDPRFLDDFNRPVLAQTFIDNIVGESITVAVNHLKSKSAPYTGEPDPTDPLDFDLHDGASWWNATRTSAAQALVDWLESDATGTGEDKFLIIGDLNSYDKEDPIDAIKMGSDDTPATADDFYDMAFEILGEDAYSYVYDGKIGYLDYAMANLNLYDFVTDVDIWHINADEADIIDYDMSYKLDAQDALYEPHAYRASDHDPVIVTLTFNQPPLAEDDAYDTDQDVTLVVDDPMEGLLANDYDPNLNDIITLDIFEAPLHGLLTLNHDGTFTYVPDPGYIGEDHFVYLMMANSPSRGAFSDIATVTIMVHPANKYFIPILFNH